jgi:hypothetical protein
MYLLDANVFIFAKRDYYPFDRVPEYWEWLVHNAQNDQLKMPQQIWDELQEQDDELQEWVQKHRDALIFAGQGYDGRVPEVLERYAVSLTEVEIEQLGADPFLIAAALEHRCEVVSKEISRPGAQRANRKVPDVCNEFGIRCINDHELIRVLDFRTDWRRRRK